MKRFSERAGRRGWIQGLTWLGLILGVILGLTGCTPNAATEEAEDVMSGLVEVDYDSYLNLSTPRETSGLVLKKGGWEYDCMECHRVLEAKWHLDAQLMEHKSVVLDHGNNRFCLNCHHPENRNAFVDYDGSEIPEADVVLLCAKCHGPQHRDWIAGAHGRANGFWDTSKGTKEKLRCIQCHDPHSPSFKVMAPMAAPTYPPRAAGELHPKSDHEEEDLHHGN